MTTSLKRLLVLTTALLLAACEGVWGEAAMRVWLDQPLDGSTFEVGESVPVQAHARDVDGPGIVEVQVFVDGRLVASADADVSAPLVDSLQTWVPQNPGTYRVRVRAVSQSGATLDSAEARVKVAGTAVAQAGPSRTPTRTPTPRIPTRTPTRTPTPRIPTRTPTRTPTVPPPAANYAPVIASVSGPSSIPNNGQRYDFTVRFSDRDGNVNRLIVTSANGRWARIDFNPTAYLSSGSAYDGTTMFNYYCNTGSTPFSDTLNVTIYDASGNASNTYSLTLACSSGSSSSGPTRTPTPTVPPPAATAYLNFSADSTSLQSGQCTTLRWSSGNVQSVYLDGQGVAGNDSRSACPSATTTYTLVANYSGGSITRQVTISVQSAPALSFPPQRSGSRVSLSISGGHGSSHRIGESVQVCWTFSGVGQVGPEGGGYSYTLRDYQPATGGSGGVNTSGPYYEHRHTWASDGTQCLSGTLTAPSGYEAFRIDLWQGTFSTYLEFAEIWIYVAP